MSGYVGDLSPEQAEALGELRAAVADVPDKPEDDDYFYLRWLRARKFNVRKAEKMLRKHLQLRKEFGADTILHDYTPPEVLKRCFPGGCFGEDREGHPVWYDNIGNLDVRGLHHSVKREDILKLKCMHGEQMARICKEFSEKKGKHIETCTIVIDFENLSLRKHNYWPGIQMMKEIIQMFEANYPERIEHVLCVRAPAIFPWAYSLVRHLIDAKTRRKIVILGGGDWQEELQRYIAPDQLPQEFGGARCEPDPWCTDYINPGYDVPPEFYLTNLTETSKEEMERVVVGRGSSHHVEHHVGEPGSNLRWEFFSTDHDIAFGVYQKRDGNHKQEVVPVKRRNSHVIPENGNHTCDTPGTYVLKFDNSYSWTRSKEVFYSVKVLPPDTELSMLPSSASGPSPSDSEDEFHDCLDDFTAEDGLDQLGLQTSLTGSAEVMEMGGMQDEASATGAVPYIIRDSIQTTV